MKLKKYYQVLVMAERDFNWGQTRYEDVETMTFETKTLAKCYVKTRSKRDKNTRIIYQIRAIYKLEE